MTCDPTSFIKCERNLFIEKTTKKLQSVLSHLFSQTKLDFLSCLTFSKKKKHHLPVYVARTLLGFSGWLPSNPPPNDAVVPKYGFVLHSVMSMKDSTRHMI